MHELKYDGYRIGAIVSGRDVRLISRNGNDWTDQFPEIVGAVALLKLRDSLLDGELCAVLPDGRTSFSAMQHYRSGATLVYYVFDALRLNGLGLMSISLLKRKQRLAKIIPSDGRVQYVEHVETEGREVLKHACRMKLEGIISKLRDAPYTPGRSTVWLKTKCIKRQEFVIGGFTDPEGARKGLGAILVGFYADDGKLAFAGKVGTGWSNAVATELRRTLEPLQREDSPFQTNGPDRALARRAHWVSPKLVAEVSFTEITPDGHVRHPSYQGLRKDKKARDVRREE